MTSDIRIKKRQTSLETANAMYKNAFALKKNKFKKENPLLTDTELNQKTAKYLREIDDDFSKEKS